MDKPNFALLIGKRLADKDKGKGMEDMEDSPTSEEDDSDSMATSAAADFGAAVKSGDPSAILSSFKEMMKFCDDDSAQEPEEGPEDYSMDK